MDFWSLGIILYEFLIGVTPFYGENVSEVFDMILTGLLLLTSIYLLIFTWFLNWYYITGISYLTPFPGNVTATLSVKFKASDKDVG